MRFLFAIIYITMSQNPRLPNGFNDITMFLVFFCGKNIVAVESNSHKLDQ